MKKDIKWAIKEIEGLETEPSQNYPHDEMIEKEKVLGILSQLDELGVLSHEWMDKYVVHVRGLGDIIEAEAVENLLVPKQEEVDQAYKAGYETDKEHATRDDEPETVASVMADFFGAAARLKEVLAMEVEELEE